MDGKRRAMYLVGCLAALLLGIGVWYSRPDPGSQLADTPSASPSDQQSAFEIVNPASNRSGEQTRLVSNAEHGNAGVTSMHRMTGQVEVRGLSGELDKVRDGTLALEVWGDHVIIERSRVVRVRRGGWFLDVSPNWTLVPTIFQSSFGRRASVQSTSLDCQYDEACKLVATWMPGITLTVVQEESGAMLSNVTVLFNHLDNSSSIAPSEPRPNNIEQDRKIAGNSPLELPCFKGAVEGWISSPGRETKRITFCGCEGRKTIALARSSSIKVIVESQNINKRLYIQAWKTQQLGGPPLRTVPVPASGEVEFSGLPLSPLMFTLSPTSEPSVLDFLDISTIEPGSPDSPRITRLRSTAPGDLAKFGSIHLAVDVNGGKGLESVGVTPVSGVSVPAGAGRARAAATTRIGQAQIIVIENLLPGEYALDFQPPVAPASVAIHAGTRSDLSIAVPSNTRLTVDVLDADDAAPIKTASVLARRVGSRGAGSWTPVEYDIARSAYFAELPAGDYEVAASAPQMPTVLKTVDARGTDSRLEMVLKRVSLHTIAVLAQEDHSGVIISPEVWAMSEVQAISPNEGRWVGANFPPVDADTGLSQAEFQVTECGQYRISFPAFDGYLNVDPIEVEVQPGKPTVARLDLVPRR